MYGWNNIKNQREKIKSNTPLRQKEGCLPARRFALAGGRPEIFAGQRWLVLKGEGGC